MGLGKKLLPVIVVGTAILSGCESSLRHDALNRCYAQSGISSAAPVQEKAAIVEACGKSVAEAFGPPEK